MNVGAKKTLPYSQAVVAGNGNLFLSGQISVDEEGKLVGADDIRKQTLQTLKNVQALLKENGYDLEDLVKVEVHLQDIRRDFDAMDEIYAEFMGPNKPSRITVGSVLFRPEFLIEVSVIATKKEIRRKNKKLE